MAIYLSQIIQDIYNISDLGVPNLYSSLSLKKAEYSNSKTIMYTTLSSCYMDHCTRLDAQNNFGFWNAYTIKCDDVYITF